MNEVPPKPGMSPRPFHGVIASFGFALEGIRFAWGSQRNFRIEVYIGIFAVILGVWLEADMVEVLLLLAVVLGSELANTALETVVDLASPEFHPLAKTAKDIAAASVLITTVIAAVIGLILFLPPLLHKLYI